MSAAPALAEALLDPITIGQVIGQLLAGSWRVAPPPLDPSLLQRAPWQTLQPLIRQAGGAGLLHRRLGTANSDVPPGVTEALREGHRANVLDEMLHQHHAEVVVRALRGAGISPLLIKGWSVARSYPAPGLRPFRDVDVVIAPAEVARAREVLRGLPSGIEVDLHDDLKLLHGRDAQAQRARRRRLDVRGIEAKILGPEDEIVLLCRHTLKHGAWRALGIVDVALLVERQAASLDWDYLLAGPRRCAREVTCVLRIARDVLAARIDVPAVTGARLPRWLLPALYRQWGAPFAVPTALERMPRTPSEVVEAARRRMQEPIAATANAGPWNDLPRLPFQLLDLVLRTARYARHGPRFVLGASHGAPRS